MHKNNEGPNPIRVITGHRLNLMAIGGLLGILTRLVFGGIALYVIVGKSIFLILTAILFFQKKALKTDEPKKAMLLGELILENTSVLVFGIWLGFGLTIKSPSWLPFFGTCAIILGPLGYAFTNRILWYSFDQLAKKKFGLKPQEEHQ